MSRRQYAFRLTGKNHKIVVGEGESDLVFVAAFCAANGIDGFEYAFAGMQNSPSYTPCGFDVFGDFLVHLEQQAGFPDLVDLVLVCDSGDAPAKRLTRIRAQVREANQTIGREVFDPQPVANVVANAGPLRLHVLTVPHDKPGGLETVCCDVAIEKLNADGDPGDDVQTWVNTFADSACHKWDTGAPWSTEKRDKLRLQATISAAWQKKPEAHLVQLLDLTGDKLIPLGAPAFGHVRNFLTQVAAL